MLVVYIIGFEIIIYTLILLILKFSSSTGTLRNNSQKMIVNESPNLTTINSNHSNGPSYKKRNLTIEIPSEQISYEDNSNFIQHYFKVINNQYQCFPLLIFSHPQSDLNKIERVTIWFTTCCLETYLNSLIFIEESLFVSSILSCFICSPATFILTLVFGLSIPKEGSFGYKLVIIYVVCWVIMICCVCLACFIEIEGDPNALILSCSFVVILEVFLMEPMRTMVKAIGFMIFKDLGLFQKFCDII